MTQIRNIKIPVSSYGPALFFIFAAVYFYRFGDYLLFFQEQESLFIFSGDYLREHVQKPGGLLEYAGLFLTQFYFYPAVGSLILSAILTLPAIVVLKINQRIGADRYFSPLIFLVPSCIMLLMQTHYYHLMKYNLGILLVYLFFLLSVSGDRKHRIIKAPLLFILLFFAGSAYAWILLGMYLLWYLSIEKGTTRYIYPLILLFVAAGSFYLFRAVLFLEPADQFLRQPLPLVDSSRHRILFYLLTGVTLLYPLAARVSFLKERGRRIIKPVSLYAVPAILFITIILLFKWYNPQIAGVLRLQKMVTGKEWDAAIRLHETSPSRNLIGQFFYNTALSETNQLSARLFSGRQDFGPTSLILPWGEAHINRGALFYYSIGLINEAHRWAYESMVIYGYRPQNMMLLVETNLINGNYRIAEKYIAILKRTINYRNRAKEYEKLLYDPGAIREHSGLGEKIRLLPGKDFFIEPEFPQRNISMILESNPDNIKALEYRIAWLLLTKDVEEVVNLIAGMKDMGYTSIPRHVEEAVLVYSNVTGILPDLGGLEISYETRRRFSQYITAYNTVVQDPSANRGILDRYNNTFWYYLHFN